MSVTDEMLMAYVDGELGEAQRMAVDSAVAADPTLFEKLERHRRLRARMGGAFASILAEAPPERLVATVKASNVVAFHAGRRAVPAWAAMAACVAIGLAVGLSVPRLGAAPTIGSDLRAHGRLAVALDKQLASAPEQDAAVRIGLTFRSADGYCRTFTENAVGGFACREGGAWRVRMAVAQTAGPANEYRTAASETPPQVLEAAQALMVGGPLDAKAEAAAQAKGWR